jgi:transcriptional regulator with XRE-family HTH domain
MTNILSGNLLWETADELDLKLAKRLRNIRRRKKLSQAELEIKSGVSLGSIKRFEQTGQISLQSLTKLAMALGCADELRRLFTETAYASIDEVIRENRK